MDVPATLTGLVANDEGDDASIQKAVRDAVSKYRGGRGWEGEYSVVLETIELLVLATIGILGAGGATIEAPGSIDKN